MVKAVHTALAVVGVAALTLHFSALRELPVAVLAALACLALLLADLLLRDSGASTAATGFPATDFPEPASRENPRAAYPKYESKDDKKSFMRICDLLVDEAIAELPTMCEMPASEVKWVKDMLDYNVKGGKMNRGLTVVASGAEILRSRGATVDSDVLSKLAVLGWCIEWLQAWLLIADDIMDDSETRRGQPCWYKNPHVQKIAINDAFLVENLVFRTLKRHFWMEPYYGQLVDLFLVTTFQTECGQLLDLLCMNIDVDDFSLTRWNLIVKYKTAFYSFYCPVALGMIVAGIQDRKAYDAARGPLIHMGIYFQAQDDYLDCFGTPEQIGKIGTDIQDKKCGWLFVHAYNELMTPEQKKYMKDHYGKCKVNSKEETAIKKMYADLKLEELYQKYEQQSYDEIMAMRPKVEEARLPWSVFELFLMKVYKRSK
mmetsp:Transcript_60504/g.131082  ORF Transcript_60504/g.131082 Transcript_60504/m.131082 type:complete len:430 (+) Transcript_60504:63-1352(+)